MQRRRPVCPSAGLFPSLFVLVLRGLHVKLVLAGQTELRLIEVKLYAVLLLSVLSLVLIGAHARRRSEDVYTTGTVKMRGEAQELRDREDDGSSRRSGGGGGGDGLALAVQRTPSPARLDEGQVEIVTG